MNNISFSESWLIGEAADLDSIKVKRIYIDINNGSIIDGIMFSQIMYWHGYDKRGNRRLRVFKDGEYWLAKRYEDWWEECRINEHTARKSINRMIESKLLIKTLYKFDGAPTLHIRINWPEFENRIKSIWYERSNGNDLRGQMEMTLEVKSLTETTTETTTENIHGFRKNSQNGDYLTNIVLAQGQTSEVTASNPQDQFFGNRDAFLGAFEKTLGRLPNLVEKEAIIEFSENADLSLWQKSLTECMLNWTGAGTPPLPRIINVYKAKGNYKKAVALEYETSNEKTEYRPPGLSDEQFEAMKQGNYYGS